MALGSSDKIWRKDPIERPELTNSETNSIYLEEMEATGCGGNDAVTGSYCAVSLRLIHFHFGFRIRNQRYSMQKECLANLDAGGSVKDHPSTGVCTKMFRQRHWMERAMRKFLFRRKKT